MFGNIVTVCTECGTKQRVNVEFEAADACFNDCEHVCEACGTRLLITDPNKDLYKKRYYFTFGASESMMIKRGYIVVIAYDKHDAINELVECFGRDVIYGNDHYVRCAAIYNQDEFEETSMFKEKQNLGVGCHFVLNGQYKFMPVGDLNGEIDVFKMPFNQVLPMFKNVVFDSMEELIEKYNSIADIHCREDYIFHKPKFTYINAETGKYVL